MQILIETPLIALLDSLGHLRNSAGYKRAAQIKESCTLPGELASAVAGHYHKTYPVRTNERQVANRRQAEFYREHCHIRIAKEDNRVVGGFCVLGGELTGLHSYTKGRGTWLLDHAVNLGATHLNCFDVPHLLALYAGRGFEVTGRLDNWNQTGPDVVSMKLKVK